MYCTCIYLQKELMEITTYSNFRKHLKKYMDMVLTHHVPLFVTRAKGEDVVVMSKADYDSMQETYYLLSSPKNAERIHNALAELNGGKGIEKTLIEE